MSRLTLVLLALPVLFVSNPADASHVGVYFDDSGEKTTHKAGPLETFRWWVIASDVPTGVRAYQFFVDVDPTIIVLERTTNPVNALNLGGGDDWMVGTGTCLYGSAIPLVTYSGMLAVEANSLRIGLLAASQSPSSSGPAYLACGADTVEDFDSTSAGVVNVDDDSWGAVKSLYGN